MKSLWLSVVLLLFSLPFQALAATEITGSLRSLDQLVEAVTLSPERLFISSNTLRLEARQPLTPTTEAEIAVENQWFYSSPIAPQLAPASEMPNTLFDATKTWREGEPWTTRLHLDRFYARGRSGSIRWAAGRQPYGFGSIVLFSPLDVIAPFSPQAFDTEYRPGIDALRLDLSTQQGDLFSVVSVFDDDSDLNSYLATGSLNQAGVDLLLIGGKLRQRTMGGVGLAADIAGLGIKGELSWYDGKKVGMAGGDLYEDFPVGAVELWYRFDNDLIVLAEYLHNGAGFKHPADYLSIGESATFVEGLTPLPGRNYLLIAPSRELHPLLNLSLLGIWNLDDESYMLRPQIDISLSDNLSLQISHTINRGKSPEFKLSASGPVIEPQSEFGSYGDSATMFLRWYF